LFESFGESGHESVGECEEFDGVDGGDTGLLLHLHAAAAAVGCAGDGVDAGDGLDQVMSDFERLPEVLGGQAEGSGHSCAAFFEVEDPELGDEQEEFAESGFGTERADMAGSVPGEPDGERSEIAAELSTAMQIEEKGAGVVCLSRDDFSIFPIGEQGIFAGDAEGGGGFGAEDGIAFAGGFCEFAEVVFGDISGGVEIGGRDHAHAGHGLMRRNVDAKAVVFEDSAEGFGKFGVMKVGEVIDEVNDGWKRGSGCGGVIRAANAGGIEEGSAGEAGKSAGSGKTGESFEE
jgi:hypothetical protein